MNYKGVPISDLLRGQRGELLVETFIDLLREYRSTPSDPTGNTQKLAEAWIEQKHGVEDEIAQYWRQNYYDDPEMLDAIRNVLYRLYRGESDGLQN